MAAQGPMVVVLAAGRGERFAAGDSGHGHKLEQPFANSTVLGTTLSNALGSGLPVVVVTTERLLSAVSAFVPDSDIVVVPAERGEGEAPSGMGYSIMAGVTARPHASGWLVLPGDMPLVQSETLRTVADALPEHLAVYAQYRGRRGHPVGFGIELYSELATLNGDEGARRLLARFPAHGVEVPDEGVLLDIDTEADLERLRAVGAVRVSAQAA